MNITININLGEDDKTPNKTPEEIILWFGGDPKKDSVSVSVSQSYFPTPPVMPTSTTATE